GELAHRQPGVPDDAEQHECGRDHAGQYGASNGRFGEFHMARKLTENGRAGRSPGCEETVNDFRHALLLRRTGPPKYDIPALHTALASPCFTCSRACRPAGQLRSAHTPGPT